MSMKTPLQNELSRIRRKLQFERLIKGLAILVVAFLLASVLGSYLLARNNFSDQAIFWARLLGGGLLVLLAVVYLLRPLFTRPSDRKVARFMEEHFPGLHNRLSTAVELIQTPSAVHPQIRQLVQRDAARKLRSLEKPRLYHREASIISMAGTAVTALVLLLLLFSGPMAYRYSLNKLFNSWFDETQPPLYSIEVLPGNAKIVRHSDVEIRATLLGFDSDDVRLHVKYEKQPAWEEVTMRPDLEGGEFLFLFFDARDRMDYYVEADGIRSDAYVIEVSEAPAVEELKVELQFPRYTGLKPKIQEDDGDIRALEGTQAVITIVTDQPVQSGVIRFEETAEIQMEALSGNQLSGSFKIERDDYYRIHLQNQEGVWNPSSDEFVIEALIDQPPSVSVARPGRDMKVTNLEEVFTEVKAEDDFGLRSLNLRYSVNGEPEQTVALKAPRSTRNVTSTHTFYLEEYELVPGDFVSYYAEASDSVASAKTDIYFLEVQPYDREYYQSQQSGGGGAGGAGQSLFLSRTQKEIISATFNITRKRDDLAQKDFEENVQTVAMMQQQLHQQAQTIAERIQRRGLGAQDPMFKRMVEHLTKAMGFMEEAALQLEERKPQTALTPEQKAYQQLLRAESLFNEIQMSMGGGQGGDGGNSTAEELADMVDLELDKKKNQYETLQQSRQQDRDQELDDAARKLKELAQRQQQELEKRRRQGSQSSSGGSGSQQQLTEEIEETARQLDRLSREERDQKLNDISRDLRQAARDLRRSQSNQNSQQAQMQQQRALDRLLQAKNSLSQQRDNQMSQSLEQLARQSEDLSQRQQEVVDQMRNLESRQKQGQSQLDEKMVEEINSLDRNKTELQEDVQRLESDLHQTARRLASKEPQASKRLKAAGNDVRDQRIPEKMAEGSELLRRAWSSMARQQEGREAEAKFWTEMARQREESVAEALQQLTENVQQAEEALGQEGGSDDREKTEAALQQLGSLVEDLESLSQRASSEQDGENAGRPRARTVSVPIRRATRVRTVSGKGTL